MGRGGEEKIGLADGFFGKLCPALGTLFFLREYRRPVKGLSAGRPFRSEERLKGLLCKVIYLVTKDDDLSSPPPLKSGARRSRPAARRQTT